MPNERNIILKVLEMYKNMPFLWDKDHPQYKNKACRTKGNNMLLSVYQEYFTSATVKTMNKKIQNLRTNYFIQMEKIKHSRRSDQREVFEPTLWYFDALRFIGEDGDNCEIKKDPLKIEIVSSSSSDAEVSYEISEISTPPTKAEKFTPPKLCQTTSGGEESVGELPRMKDEEWEILGKSIGLQLRGLDRKQHTITQKLISEAIYYAKFGLLTQSSYIAVEATSPP